MSPNKTNKNESKRQARYTRDGHNIAMELVYGAEKRRKVWPDSGIKLTILACALGGVGSPVRPFARPPDRPEMCENN